MTEFESASSASSSRFEITESGREASRRKLTAAIFLDRDGVVIEDRDYLADPGLIRFVPGALEALRRLQSHFRLVIITNQSGIARGFFTEQELSLFHRQLLILLNRREVFIDAVYYCPHHPDLGRRNYRRRCVCRKPEPGLIFQAAREFKLDLERSFMVGDKESDIVAGRRAGLFTFLLRGDLEKLELSTLGDGQAGSWTEIVRTIFLELSNQL